MVTVLCLYPMRTVLCLQLQNADSIVFVPDGDCVVCS